MNADYAHLLQDARLNFARVGTALKAVMATRNMTLAEVASESRVSRATLSRVSNGFQVGTLEFLKICIWADLNPFEALCPLEPCEDTLGVLLFHGKAPQKPSEKSQEFETERPDNG